MTYRGDPHTGGQGVYTRHVVERLIEMGHHVEVFSGPPYPRLSPSVKLTKLPSLDLFRSPDPFRTPKLREFKSYVDVLEYALTCTAAFAEPLTFSLRAERHLRSRLDEFDIVHDNQCLGYGIWRLARRGLPVVATIHHPITVDRRVEIARAASWRKRLALRRFYSFTPMQSRVARRAARILTVSRSSFDDLTNDMGIDPSRVRVVNVGVDAETFKPQPDVAAVPGRVMTTASADVAMKGLSFALEAIAKLRVTDPNVHLVVIGKPREGSAATRLIDTLGLEDAVTFTSGVSEARIVELYAQAQVAVVPSLYEGFSLPAVEAMACGVTLVATTGGALSEVTGTDGETCLAVPPADADALAVAIGRALGSAELRARIGGAGRERVLRRYSWHHTATQTAEHYREVLREHAAR